MFLRITYLFIFLSATLNASSTIITSQDLKVGIERVVHRETPTASLSLLESPAYIVTWLAKDKLGLPHIALFADTPEQSVYFSFSLTGLKKFMDDYTLYRGRAPSSTRTNYHYQEFAFPLFGISSQALIDMFGGCKSLYQIRARRTGISIPSIHQEKNVKFHLLGYIEKDDGVYSNCSSFIASMLDILIEQRSMQGEFSREFLQSINRANIKVVEPEYLYPIFAIESLRKLYGMPTYTEAEGNLSHVSPPLLHYSKLSV